jgi:hypothetical protein
MDSRGYFADHLQSVRATENIEYEDVLDDLDAARMSKTTTNETVDRAAQALGDLLEDFKTSEEENATLQSDNERLETTLVEMETYARRQFIRGTNAGFCLGQESNAAKMKAMEDKMEETEKRMQALQVESAQMKESHEIVIKKMKEDEHRLRARARDAENQLSAQNKQILKMAAAQGRKQTLQVRASQRSAYEQQKNNMKDGESEDLKVQLG